MKSVGSGAVSPAVSAASASLTCGLALPRSRAAAELGEIEQLDAHMVLVLAVLVGKFQPHSAQQLAHLEGGLAEAHSDALGSVHGLPRRRRRLGRPDEELRVLYRHVAHAISFGGTAAGLGP